MDVLINTSQTKHRGDLVILGFENLISKHGQTITKKSATEMARGEPRLMPIKLINSQRDCLIELYSYLLPLLSRQMRCLYELLLGIDSHEEPGSQLKLILDLQPELDHTLGHIRSTTAVASRELSSIPPGRVGIDSYKSVILDHLRDIEEDLLPKFPASFRKFGHLIIQLDLSSEIFEGQADSDTDTYLEHTKDGICSEIPMIVDCLRDFDYDNSDVVTDNIGCTLRSLMHWKRRKYLLALSQEDIDLRVQIAQSAIPVSKLARLFFRTLSRRELITEHISPFSERLTKELTILQDLPGKIVDELYEVMDILVKSDGSTTNVLRRSTRDLASQFFLQARLIKKNFRRSLIALDMFISFIPNNSGFRDRKYFRTWFRSWDTLFTLAINRMLDNIEILSDEE
ncbi:hypothetical protein KEM48_010810 [Puccinia striiformis f. sp. tritici PST-130]|nr:hypothetical protein KEM48_010810 [Puccinia striiformis f. sp. tritici PST-130]